MSKKVLILVAVTIVLSLTASSCSVGGGGCPAGMVWNEGGPNNPSGFCTSADGDVASPAQYPASAPSGDGSWMDSDTPVQQIECGFFDSSAACKH